MEHDLKQRRFTTILPSNLSFNNNSSLDTSYDSSSNTTKANISKLAHKILKNTFRNDRRKTLNGLPNDADGSVFCVHSFKCSYVLNDNLIPGKLFLTQNTIFFQSQNFYIEDDTRIKMKLQDIENVKKERRRAASILEDTIRIQLTDNTYHQFTNFKFINSAYKLLKNQSLKRSDSYDTLQPSQKLLKRQSSKSTSSVSRPQSVSLEDDNENNNKIQRSASYTSINTDTSTDQSEVNEPVASSTPTNIETTTPQLVDDGEEKKLNELYNQFGKEYLNLNLPISSEKLYQYIFEENEFFEAFWKMRKFFDIKFHDWEKIGRYRSRKLEYTMDGVVGSKFCKTLELEKVIKHDPQSQIIVESESANKGIPYADAFTVHCRFIIKKIDENTCNLTVICAVNFLYKPNFIAKTFIEKNCISGLTDSYNAFAQKITKDVEKLNSNSDNSSKESSVVEETKTKKTDDEKTTHHHNHHRRSREGSMATSQSSQSVSNTASAATNIIKNDNLNFTSVLDALKSPIYKLIIYLMLILLVLNIYLIYKLNKLEILTSTIDRCTQTCSNYNNK